MNLPNKLTVLRIILTPIFMLTLVWQFSFHYLVSLLIFIAASITTSTQKKGTGSTRTTRHSDIEAMAKYHSFADMISIRTGIFLCMQAIQVYMISARLSLYLSESQNITRETTKGTDGSAILTEVAEYA